MSDRTDLLETKFPALIAALEARGLTDVTPTAVDDGMRCSVTAATAEEISGPEARQVLKVMRGQGFGNPTVEITGEGTGILILADSPADVLAL